MGEFWNKQKDRALPGSSRMLSDAINLNPSFCRILFTRVYCFYQ